MDQAISYAVPNPSLSRDLQYASTPPFLVHSLHQSQTSVLSLAANDHYIFSGNQNNDISVWDKRTFRLHHTLRGHTGSVLALEYAADKQWLFSSSGDSTVRVWSTKTFEPLYVIHPYLENAAGDLFSLAWAPTLQTIFVGCQNTSLQWYNFSDLDPALVSESVSATSGTSTPAIGGSRRAHKFFDSYPLHERRPADLFAKNGLEKIHGRQSPESEDDKESPPVRAFLNIPALNVIDTAHFGYIYCITLLRDRETGVQIATGSGDETVKLWNCDSGVPQLVHEFTCNHGAVLALDSRGDTVYAGCQDGYVKVLDLETKTSVRTIIVEENVDILSVSMFQTDLYTCSADGIIKRWSASFDCSAVWKGHEGIVLSSTICKRNGSDESGFCLLTGGNDGYIKVWEANPPKVRRPILDQSDYVEKNKSCIGRGSIDDTMIFALSKFVSIPSVSRQLSNREDCRQGAIWLRKCLGQLGAQTNLVATGEGRNPLVIATFRGSVTNKEKPRILFYGHYDVIAAPSRGWNSDPFTLTGNNGYLYGRGATDNKGPIIAVACAAADLLARRALDVDLVFLIEGEEECGSAGFKEAVQANKALLGEIDAILVSNSTWVTDDKPCITYGLRGVVHTTVEVSNDRPDVHSGIEGGAVAEPMLDLVHLLAGLINDKNVVQIPGFYAAVRPETEQEANMYKLLSEITKKPASSISSRWREPSLTIHGIEISGPKNSTVIPSKVKAQVSLRIVPDQHLETIVRAFENHLSASFARLQSPNNLNVTIDQTADWWLGDLEDVWSKALENSIKEEWGVQPLRIREGGSIPSIPYLEKEFKCHALQLPMGQSSDQAHLPNERISLVNLYKGKAVIERFLTEIAKVAQD